MSDSKPPNSDPEFDETIDEDIVELLADMDIDQWLETLRCSDRSLYNLMALEVWSIAKTMDGLVPGFWSRFMANRRTSLQQFIQQKQAKKDGEFSDRAEPPSASEQPSDFPTPNEEEL